MFQDYYFFKIQDMVSILFHLYPAMMSFIISLFIISWVLWSALYMKIMKQYDFDYPWLSFIPLGKLYFRLKIKEKPYIVLAMAVFEIVSAVILYFMVFSWWMLLPGIVFLFCFTMKWLTISVIDGKIWEDFKYPKKLIVLSWIPFIGLLLYLFVMTRIAFSPELYYEYEEDDIGDW